MSEVKANSVVGLTKPLPDNLLPVTASAWVNFDGTGAVAIRDSHNVSSITDNGVGSFSVNYDVALEDGNYSVITDTVGTVQSDPPIVSNIVSISTGSFRMQTAISNSAATDRVINTAVVFGGQS